MNFFVNDSKCNLIKKEKVNYVKEHFLKIKSIKENFKSHEHKIIYFIPNRKVFVLVFFPFNEMLFWLKYSLITVDISCYIRNINNNAI